MSNKSSSRTDTQALLRFLMYRIIIKRSNRSTSSYYNNESLIYHNSLSINSHAFWVNLIVPKSFLANPFCKFQNPALNREKLGGNRRRYEPSNCKEWKQKEEVWSILQKGGFSKFMEKLHGWDGTVTSFFCKNWRKGMLKMGDHTIEIDEDLIAQATGLRMEGYNFYRDKKVSKEAIDKYPETEKEKK